MNWIIISYILLLGVLTFNKDRFGSSDPLKLAWQWFSGVFFAQAFFTLFRAGNHDDTDLVLVEIWANGSVWLFIGMSIIQLPRLLASDDYPYSRTQDDAQQGGGRRS